METPKEKAEILVNKFWMKNQNDQDSYVCAVDCAKIAVEEIIDSNPMIEWGESDAGTEYKDNADYWEEVLNELNKL